MVPVFRPIGHEDPSEMPDATTMTGAPPGTATAPRPRDAASPLTEKAPLAYRGRGYGAPFGKSERRDLWWVKPLSQALGLLVLFGYATWAAFQGRNFGVEDGLRHYLSPVYSPK